MGVRSGSVQWSLRDPLGKEVSAALQVADGVEVAVWVETNLVPAIDQVYIRPSTCVAAIGEAISRNVVVTSGHADVSVNEPRR